MLRPWVRRRWRTDGLLSTTLDETLLSAVSLGLAMVMIHWGSKPEYGVFALVGGLILLLRGGQNALVLTPLATLGGRLSPERRVGFVRTMARLQSALGMLVSAGLVLGLILATGDWQLAAGSGLALLGAWVREYRRAVAILDSRNTAALAGDALFALLTVGLVMTIRWVVGSVNAAQMLAASGLAAGCAAYLGFRVPAADSPAAPSRSVVRSALEQARWSLPGTAVVWGQNSGYAYAVAVMLGSAAVGQVSAARLFVVPMLLVGVAWNRMTLPRSAGVLAAGGGDILRRQCVRALRAAIVGSIAFAGFLLTAFALGLERLLPPDYAGCQVQVMAWAAFAAVNLCRSIASNALIARLEFRALFAMNVASAVVSLLMVVVLLLAIGSTGAILGLVFGELALLALCWRALLAWRTEDHA